MPEFNGGTRFPGYDVLDKRNTPSWNETTRRVIDARLALPREPGFFTELEFATVTSIADRIVPQPPDRPPVPVAALIDHKLKVDSKDGFRNAGMPSTEGQAWRQGLRALDAEAQAMHGRAFRELEAHEKDALLSKMQDGELTGDVWGGMSSKEFFVHRMGRDIVLAYYSFPTSWNDIGWGGPASPRGYVRMDFDERDSWEAAEVKNGDVEAAERRNRHVGK